MNATIIDGREIARQIRAEVTGRVESSGLHPKLVAVLVGEDPASHLYVNSKRKACAEVGLDSDTLYLPADISQSELIDHIRQLGLDASVHGILVQLPLPSGLSDREVLDQIPPDKDVDGLHPINVGRLALGRKGLVPCTPAGVVELLVRSGVDLKGKEVVIVGRSQLVGKPLAQLLLARHCTVTICHSRTRELASVTSRAEILIAAMGRPAALGREHIRPEAIVIDVGTNRVNADQAPSHFFTEGSRTARLLKRNGSVLVGDVDPFAVREIASAFTPVPGGVGPMTIAMLLSNTLQAAELASANR